MDTTMGNVYYNGSNANTHLYDGSNLNTTTSIGQYDEKGFDIDGTFHGDTRGLNNIAGTFHYDMPNVKGISKLINDAVNAGCNKAIKDAVNSEYGIYVTTRTVRLLPAIEKVIFNPPATVVIWEDGVKTVVKCGEGEEFCEETGLAMAIARRYSGSRSRFLKTVRGAKRPEERE